MSQCQAWVPVGLSPFSSPGPLPPPEVPVVDCFFLSYYSQLPVQILFKDTRTLGNLSATHGTTIPACSHGGRGDIIVTVLEDTTSHSQSLVGLSCVPSSLMLPLMTMSMLQATGWPMCPVSAQTSGKGQKSLSCPWHGYSCETSHPMSISQLTSCPPLAFPEVRRIPWQ